MAFVVASVLGVAAANADTFQIIGGTSIGLTSTTNPNGSSVIDGIDFNGKTITYFTSADNGGAKGLFINWQQIPVHLVFTYLGSEASNLNQADNNGSFAWDNSQIFTNNGPGHSNVGDTVTANYGGAVITQNPNLVPLQFKSDDKFTQGPGIDPKVAVNGNIDPAANLPGMLFAIGYYQAGPNTVYAFFEEGFDHDFDDMVVKITAVPDHANTNVPLPPAVLLFGSALAGLGLLSRRRKQPSVTA